MQPIVYGLAALAVAVLFYFWRGYHRQFMAKQRVLRERVAFMLWVMAEKSERPSRTIPLH
jgi:hypothetical protein